MKTYRFAQALGFFDMDLRVQWLVAKGNPLSRLAELVATTDGAVYADPDTECRGVEAEAMLAQKQPRKLSGKRAYRNCPSTDEQKENNRQKSKIRARIEHVFGYMSQSVKGFYLRYIGRRRNAVAIGLINLIYKPAPLRADRAIEAVGKNRRASAPTGTPRAGKCPAPAGVKCTAQDAKRPTIH